MATPTDPTVPVPATTVNPDDATNLNNIAYSATQAQTAFNFFGDAASKAQNILGGFYDSLSKVGVNLSTNQRLTEGQTTAFGMLTTSVLGTRKAFDNLNNVDTSRLNSFSKQWTDLQSVLDKSPGAKTAEGTIDLLTKALVAMKAPADQIKSAVAEGVGGLKSYAASFFESADNALRLQNSIIQLSARTGSLSDVLKLAGPNLDNINQLTATYQKAVTDASAATDVSADILEQYYAILVTVPGALQATTKSADDNTKTVSLLTAATQYAIGSGRDYKDVVDDLRTAFRNYNISGGEALQFTARMGELSNKFGVEISDVRDSLRATADSFKIFGNEAEGAAKMMNQYLGALESTGLSGATSIGVIQDLTKGIQGLGLAQKSFLSAQTGGPGGLMGAFQIEKLLREGKIDDVMAKVRATLSRQFGQIVTLDEASKSPQAAAQMTKQIAMLRQGPLGSFARDDQTAMRLLEAMKNQQTGKAGATVTALAGAGERGGTQDIMKTGIEIQKKSHTELSNIRQLIQNAQGQAGIANLTATQRLFTAGVGARSAEGEVAGQYRRDMSRDMQRAGITSGQTASDLAAGLQTGQLSTRQSVGANAASMINGITKFTSEVPEAMKSVTDNLGNMMGRTNTGTVGSPEMQGADTTNDKVLDAIGAIPDIPGFEGPGGGVGNAASSIANRQSRTTVTGAPSGMPMHPNMAATDTSSQNMGEITVHVEGYCLDCGEKIRSRSQSYAVAPQIK